MPVASVLTTELVTLPSPAVTAKVTAAFASGVPMPSLMITEGGTDTAVPAIAAWLLPAMTTILGEAMTNATLMRAGAVPSIVEAIVTVAP